MLALLALLQAAAALPTVSPGRGLYDAPLTVTLGAEHGGALRYSLDGADPNTPYTGPLSITESTTLRVAELDADGIPGPTLTATYLLPAAPYADDPDLMEALRAIPQVALTTHAPLGEAEQAATFEWIEPDGRSAVTEAGLNRTGRTSVIYPKTSLRLHFRERYGAPRWDFEPFIDDGYGAAPVDSFDALSLRSGNHDSVFYLGRQAQYLRTPFMDQTERAMGHLAPHDRWAFVWLDRAPIGLYHLRERFGADLLSRYLGGEADDYESINGGNVVDGDGAGWAALLATADDYEAAAPYLDLPNFLDYMVLNFWAANAWDWLPSQNWVAAGPAGTGPFRFQSYDNDICLVYPVDTNILSAPGPSSVFARLLAEGHPDFQVALKDALHRNLNGVLSPAAAAARYTALADEARPLLRLEEATWGGGTWTVDGDWETERQRILDDFIAGRANALFGQAAAAGWWTLPAPTFSLPAGLVAEGADLDVTADADAEVWLTLDGADPRAPGGDPAPQAAVAGSVLLPYTTTVSARLRDGDDWGPIESRLYEVDAAPALVLNEWNAVDAGESLKNGDPALGAPPGNGGDWLEFVVIADHLDLRGWTLTLTDRAGPAGTLTFTEAPVLADLRAGTLLTVAADLPEDTAYDPAAGDWRLHLRAGPRGPGDTISATPFRVTHRDWQLTARDAAGRLRYGPVGEGIGALQGLGKDEVAALHEDPGPYTRRTGPYDADADSTFAAPNTWGEQTQRLGPLREAALPAAGAGAALLLFGLALGLRRRAPLLLVFACAPNPSRPREKADPDTDTALDSAAPPDTAAHLAPEVCDGVDNDDDGLIDDEDPDLADPLPFWADRDGDGYGDEATLVTACAAGPGAVVLGGDCDDTDPTAHPGATEPCDGIDHDCDGAASDTPGASPACAVDSCLAARDLGLSTGPTYLALPSGAVSSVYCDQDTDGGGWTLGFLRNSAATGSQGDFGAADEGLTALAVDPALASAAATAARGWLDLNAFAWSELRVAAYAAGALSYRSELILRTQLRLAFGEPGYLLYGGDSPYVWCGGPASYTDAGEGAVNNPAGATLDCKGHSGLGSGWDFSESELGNTGLTLCGSDGANILASSWAGGWVAYGTPGGAQALWVR